VTDVTPEQLTSFLRANLTGRNYALLHGLQALKKAEFTAIVTALYNRDITIQDLGRLGAFTEEEVTDFMNNFMVPWTSPFVSNPGVYASDGYATITAIGLVPVIQEARDAANLGARPFEMIRDTRLRWGAGTQYGSFADLLAVWTNVVMPAALTAVPAGTIGEVFPSSMAAVKALPINNSDATRQTMLWDWYKTLLAPIAPSPGAGAPVTAEAVMRALFGVNDDDSIFRLNPSMAEFILGARRPYRDFPLLTFREAMARTASGSYTGPELIARVAAAVARSPSHVRASRDVSEIEFDLRVARKWSTFAASTVTNLTQAEDALDALYLHRDRIRRFAEGAYNACRGAIFAPYPAARSATVLNDQGELVLAQ